MTIIEKILKHRKSRTHLPMAKEITKSGFLRWLGITEKVIELENPRILIDPKPDEPKMKPPFVPNNSGIRYVGAKGQNFYFSWEARSNYPGIVDREIFSSTAFSYYEAMIGALLLAYEMAWMRKRQGRVKA